MSILQLKHSTSGSLPVKNTYNLSTLFMDGHLMELIDQAQVVCLDKKEQHKLVYFLSIK